MVTVRNCLSLRFHSHYPSFPRRGFVRVLS